MRSVREFSAARDLDLVPLHTRAYWLLHSVKETSLAHGRAAYSALLMFPGAQSLCFEPLLRTVKRQSNPSVPKYRVYYDVPKLLDHGSKLPATSEMEVRRRLILCLGSSLFSGARISNATGAHWNREVMSALFGRSVRRDQLLSAILCISMQRRKFCTQF